jgi:D-citramalate synthase
MEKRKSENNGYDTVMVNKPQESLSAVKLTIAQLLLEELNVDRIEIASARKRGEFQGVKGIMAGEHRIRNRIEVLTL